MTSGPITPDAKSPAWAQHPEHAQTAERLARRPWPTTPLNNELSVSFEFFPANDWASEAKLAGCLERLSPLGPSFVSVTYGAGGTTQERTVNTIRKIAGSSSVPVAGHLTCVGADKDQVHAVVEGYREIGVRHIVALRGDPPKSATSDSTTAQSAATSGGGSVRGAYGSAVDLVAGLRHEFGDEFELSVAAYPEVHPRATSPEADLDNLKAKLDAGADRAITQFFFDTDEYLRFVERARKAGIFAPIVPGIMPITNFANVQRFANRCGTRVPDWMRDLFEGLDDVPEVREMVAATVAAEQCRRLAEHGSTHFHFYTMNKPELTGAVCRILGFRPGADVASADGATQVAS